MDLFRAADPGFDRLYEAVWATTSSGLAAVTLYILAMKFDQSFSSASIGVAIGMNSVLLAKDPTERERKITLALLTVPSTVSITIGLLLGDNQFLLSAGFVAVIFIAVLARKFGERGYAMGLIAFSSYVLSIFFQKSLEAIPWILTTIVTSIALAWIVRFVIFPKNHTVRLFRAKRALLARVSVVLRLLMDIASDQRSSAPPSNAGIFSKKQDKEIHKRWTSVSQNMEELNDTMLLLESILVDDLRYHFHTTRESGQPDYVSQQAEWFLAIETLCARIVTIIFKMLADDIDIQKRRAIVEAIATVRASLPPASFMKSSQTMDSLQHIANAQPDNYDIRRLAILLRDLQKYADKTPSHNAVHEKTNHNAAPNNTQQADNFHSSSPPRNTKAWYHDVYFQTAIQAGLAASLASIAGYWIAPARWHWAVIATFVIFVRTKTRGETLLKAWHRFLGTIFGVAAGLILAIILQDHLTTEVIGLFLCIFLGYYFLRVSYIWLITFLTLEAALLYGILGTPSPELLFIRVQETILGVLIGILVAAFVLPAKTRPQINAQMKDLLYELSNFYEDITCRIEKNAPVYASTKKTFQLSRSFQALRTLAVPLSSNIAPSGFINIKYQLVLLSALVYYSRTLAMIASFGDYDQQTRNLLKQMAHELTHNFDCLAAAISDPQKTLLMQTDPDNIRSLDTAIIQQKNAAILTQAEPQPNLATRTIALLLTLQSNEDVIYQLADEFSKEQPNKA